MKSFKKVGEIKVLQFDKNMNYIATHKSYIKAAKSIGVNPSCISNCCNKKSKSSNGFIFVKESEYNNTSKNNKYDITINIS